MPPFGELAAPQNAATTRAHTQLVTIFVMALVAVAAAVSFVAAVVRTTFSRTTVVGVPALILGPPPATTNRSVGMRTDKLQCAA